MRRYLIASILASLAACSTAPTGSPKASDLTKIIVRSSDETITITEGDYHCVRKNAPNPNKYPSCDDGIPVIVLLKADGCLSLVPYYRLVIHTTGDRTVVRWKIHGPDGYKFDDTNGIALKRKANQATDPSAIYDGKQKENNRTFKYEVVVGAPNFEFKHDAVVLSPNGTPCTPIDPLIQNSDN